MGKMLEIEATTIITCPMIASLHNYENYSHKWAPVCVPCERNTKKGLEERCMVPGKYDHL